VTVPDGSAPILVCKCCIGWAQHGQ
jgi:hypothetical protein